MYLTFLAAAATRGVLRKNLYESTSFNKIAGLLQKGLWHRCFPVSLAKFLRAPFLQNTSGWLLLSWIKPYPGFKITSTNRK